MNTALRRTVSAGSVDVPIGTLAQRNFTIVRRAAAMFDVIRRMRRRNAIMGVVIDGSGPPRADKVVGVITKEHVADEVAISVSMFPR